MLEVIYNCGCMVFRIVVFYWVVFIGCKGYVFICGFCILVGIVDVGMVLCKKIEKGI